LVDENNAYSFEIEDGLTKEVLSTYGYSFILIKINVYSCEIEAGLTKGVLSTHII